MTVIQYSFKLPVRGEPPAQDLFIPVFHDWIRTGALTDDVLVDVADYAHVQGGPGVLLVCHEGQYVVDRSRGAVGLAYHRRRGVAPADAVQGAAVGLSRLVRAAKLLAADTRLGGLAFDTTRLEIRVLDRLRVGNDDAGWNLVRDPLRQAIGQAWAGEVALERVATDARQPLTIHATLPERAIAALVG